MVFRSRFGVAGVGLVVCAVSVVGCMAEPGAPTPGMDAPPLPAPSEDGFAPGPARFRRLVASQYRNAVQDLLGPEAAAVVRPPDDPALNGLKGIAASELALSAAEVTAYEASARAAIEAAQAQGSLTERFVECGLTDTAGNLDLVCADNLVAAVLTRAFRRPAEDAEKQRYAGLVEQTYASVGVDGATRALFAAAMQSPHFLYRTEMGQPVDADPSTRALQGHELANRLSFFLTDGPPDAALREAAASGRLNAVEGLRAEADRLLATPAARQALSAFYDEYLRLGELTKLVKDPDVYPQTSAALRADMREETLRLVEDVVWTQNVDFRELFRAPYTFANQRLADLYGLDAGFTNADQWRRLELPNSSLRGGYLGQASFLALNSHPVSSSPTLRGKFVQEVLLCQPIPAPPPDVSTEFAEPPEGQPPLTTREKVQLHLSQEACAGCHAAMDPIGLGLENFDAIGAFRSQENGIDVDASSRFLNVDFVGARQLGDIISQNDRAAFCVVRNLFRHATGHIETEGEAASLAIVDAAFSDAGFRLQDAMRALVVSDAFRFVSGE